MSAYYDSYLRLLERCYFENLVEISFKSNPFKGSRERGLPVVAGAGPKPGHSDFIISTFDAAVAGSPQKTGSETDLHVRSILGIYWAVPWGLAQRRAERGVT